MLMKRILKNIKGDKVIWMVVLILSIFSILAVYSSISTLAYKYKGGNTWFYFFKHFFLLGFGLFLMFLVHLVEAKYFARLAKLLLYITVPLLALTLLSGTNINDANRWLTVPVVNISFQTSDLAKLSLIIYLSRIIAQKQEQMHDMKKGFLPIIIPVIAVCGLIFPANLSTAALLFLTSIIIMYVGRVNVKFILSTIGVGLAGVALLVSLSKVNPDLLPRLNTWVSRIENFGSDKSNDSNYQVEQAKIAIATGGVFGKMPGNSTQRNFLPHPYSDFIYAIILEEYGMIGGVLIMLLYLILLYRGIRIASKCKGVAGPILVMGLSFSLVFQAFVNMGVAVNIFPVTGQPLPLVSMGGTSLWFTSVAIGIILSISKTSTEETEEKVEVANVIG